PKYNSSIDILVNQKENNAQVQYAAQQADLQVINTYKDVLTKPIILTSVLKEVKRTDNYQGNLSTLEKSVKVLNQTNSQVITVSVTDKNAYVAVDVANTIGKVFAKKVKKMMQVDNVTIVSNAKVNTTPVSPNKKLSALIGVVVGLLLGILFAIVKELTDKTVKDSGFLTDELGLTNIGSV
ncbi:chain-length determining protein, partial [Ligilactobacillus salivarius]